MVDQRARDPVMLDPECDAGSRRVEMAATLAGVPLYAACGYEVIEHINAVVPGGVPVRLARMGKAIAFDVDISS